MTHAPLWAIALTGLVVAACVIGILHLVFQMVDERAHRRRLTAIGREHMATLRDRTDA